MSFLLLTTITDASAQTIDPPTTADEFGWLRWAVITLLGVLVAGGTVFFTFVKKSFEERLTDRDTSIMKLLAVMEKNQSENAAEIDRMRKKIDQLSTEKDLIHKDMQEKIIPALLNASDLIRTFLKIDKH